MVFRSTGNSNVVKLQHFKWHVLAWHGYVRYFQSRSCTHTSRQFGFHLLKAIGNGKRMCHRSIVLILIWSFATLYLICVLVSCFVFFFFFFFLLHVEWLIQLDDSVHNMLPRVPIPLQEAISRLTCKEPASRPTAQLLQLIKYFRWVLSMLDGALHVDEMHALHLNWQQNTSACVICNDEHKTKRKWMSFVSIHFQWSRCACDAIFRCDKYEGSNTEGTFLSKYFAWSFAIHSAGKLRAYMQVTCAGKKKKLYCPQVIHIRACVWHLLHFMWLETLVATRMAVSATRNACCWSARSCSTTGTNACNGIHTNRIREHHFANIQVCLPHKKKNTIRHSINWHHEFWLDVIFAGLYSPHQNQFKLPLPYWRIFMWY